MPRPALRGRIAIASWAPVSAGRLLGPHESGDLVWIDKHLDRSRLARRAADELPVLQLLQHLMDGWRCGPEESLQIRLGRRPSEHHPVVVYECQVLALLRSESLGHAEHLSTEHQGSGRGASASALDSRSLGTSASDALGIHCIGAERWIKRQHDVLDFRLPHKVALATSFPAIGELLWVRPGRGTLRYRDLRLDRHRS
jgi:hypothetical protein